MRIDIRDENGVVGALVEITEQPSDELVGLMTAWRQGRVAKLNQRLTIRKTREWLETFFKSTSRLFWIMENDKFIGQCGFCNLTTEGAELNYFIRGAGSSDKELVIHAGLALIKWLRGHDIKDIYAMVAVRNKRPMELTLDGSFKLAKGYSFDGSYRKFGKKVNMVRVDLDLKKLHERYPWL